MGGVVLHCLGIGSASQDRFLTLLARQTGGVSRFVMPKERVDEQVLELFASVRRPLATDVRVTPSNKQHIRLAPQPSKMVFSGIPLVVYGETDGAPGGSLRISWQREGRRRHFELPLTLEPKPEADTARLLRGARLITDAESLIAVQPGPTLRFNAERQKKLEKLEQLSREYDLASRAMALVAVVKRPGDRPGEQPSVHVVQVGMPEETNFDSYFCDAFLARKSSVRTLLFEPALSERFKVHALSLCEMRDTTPLRLARRLVASIQPDGGMPGVGKADRAVKTSVALLFLTNYKKQLGNSHAKKLAMLIAFLKSVSDELTGTERQIVESAIRAAKRTKVMLHDWLPEVVALFSGEEMDADELWRKMQEPWFALR